MSAAFTDLLRKYTFHDAKNTSGESIPPFSVARVNSVIETNGIATHELKKPSTTFSRTYAVTGQAGIINNGYGAVFNCPVVLVTYDTGTPSAGETWGPKPSQWSVSKGYPGFVCLGIVDSTNKIALARQEPYDTIIGKLTGALSATTNTVNVWTGDGGSEAVVSGWTISARPWWDIGSCTFPVSTTAKVVCKCIDGQWYILPMPWDRTAISGYSGSVVQYLKHDTSGCLAWETPSAC
jgi:hypothetical protein